MLLKRLDEESIGGFAKENTVRDESSRVDAPVVLTWHYLAAPFAEIVPIELSRQLDVDMPKVHRFDGEHISTISRDSMELAKANFMSCLSVSQACAHCATRPLTNESTS